MLIVFHIVQDFVCGLLNGKGNGKCSIKFVYDGNWPSVSTLTSMLQ